MINNLFLIILLAFQSSSMAFGFDFPSGAKNISVVIKTSPDPKAPLHPALKDGFVVRIADILNKGIKDGSAKLDKKTNKLSLNWSYSAPCSWHVFAKTYGILAVFRDKNGLEIGSYFSKKEFAPPNHIAEETKKNPSFARATFQNAIPLKESGNSYVFTLTQIEAESVELVELGFNTEKTLPTGAIGSTIRDYCK